MSNRWVWLALLCWGAWIGLAGCPGPDDDDSSDDDDAGDDDAGDDDAGDDDSGDDDTADDDTADDDASDDDASDDDSSDDDSSDDDSSDDDSSDDDVSDDDVSDDDDDTAAMDVHILEIQLDVGSLAPVGYKHFDFPANPTTPNQAPAIVSAALPGSLVDGCVAASTHLDFHYCYAAPGDFGGAALVDGRSGELVFAGETIWMGNGGPLFPLSLGPAQDLMVAVHPPTIAPTSLEYHLQGLETQQAADAAMDAVREMGYVMQWVGWGTYDALVYLHPYEVGAYNPAAADWIVLLVM